ncbi:LADA_0E14664g1_1 [Lachancea dasiensis]|uniref:LADA_0E14664g1_1 n=1 Tax=Lachancea dasiensis TaxID=1072105 RepID=A0A1G4JGP2_9SACH|nr:LADA_0E14664g1_1 [Lachancea dasiensis]
MQALPPIRKRNRVSLSCLECKRRKTKCDKKKPKCTRCEKLQVPCTYMHSTPGQFPKAHLQVPGLLAYNKLEQAESLGSPYPRSPTSPPVASSAGTDSGIEMPAFNVQNWRDIRVSLDDSEDTIVALEQKRYLHKPYSVLAMLQRDHYLRALVGSVWGFTLSGDHRYLGKAKDGSPAAGEKSVYHFIGDVIQQSSKQQTQLSPAIFLNNSLFACDFSLEKAILSENKLPDALIEIIEELQSLLPTMPALEFLLKNFYSTLYPIYPFLDIPSFEESIRKVLHNRGDGSSHYILDVDPPEVRRLLENLCILVMILKISHAAVLSNDDAVTRQGTMSLNLEGNDVLPEKVVELAQRILLMLNISLYTSENSVCCLLYYWVYQSLLSSNASFKLPAPVILGLGAILQLATILGLHKDPSSFKILTKPAQSDRSILNYRRKLWLGVTVVRMSELLPNGCGFFLSTNVFAKTFMQRCRDDSTYMSAVIKDNPNATGYDIPLHELYYNEYLMFHEWGKLGTACSPVAEPTSLSSINKILTQCEHRLQRLFPLSYLSVTTDSENLPETSIGHIDCAKGNPEVNYHHIRAAKTFTSNCQGRLILQTVTGALAHNLENKLRCSSSQILLEPLQYYIKESFRYCTELTKLLMKYLMNELNSVLPQKFGYAYNRMMSICLLRVFMSLTSLVLRLSYYEVYLEGVVGSASFLYQNVDNSRGSSLLHLAQGAKEKLVLLLQVLVTVSSRTICKTHSRCEKTVSLIKYILHLIEIGHLVEATNRLWDQKLAGNEIPKPVRNAILFKWGIDVEDAKAVKDELLDANIMEAFDEELLSFFCSSLENLDLKQASEMFKMNQRTENEPLAAGALSESLLDDANIFSGDVLKYFDVFDDFLGDGSSLNLI